MQAVVTLPWAPKVGHIRHPRPGVPWVYIGRTMPRLKGPDGQPVRDEGFGNPFKEGRNSTDPVNDYRMLLWGDADAMGRAGWNAAKVAALNARLPRLLGRDLLCWCHKKPFAPSLVNADQWLCHGCPLRLAVLRWEWNHPVEAAAIRRELLTATE
jgi:hypothetical protein